MTNQDKKQNKLITYGQDDRDRDVALNTFDHVLAVRQETSQLVNRLDTMVDRLGKVTAVDAYPPPKVAEKAEAAGVTKGTRNTLSTILLGILAGVFIGLGAMFCTVVTTDTGLGFGLTKLLGGLAFCLGLILVVVAGAELFTGNSLIVMSWMSGQTSLARLLRNWGLVYFANLVGGLTLAALMFYTYQWTFSGYGVGANALAIANAKVNLSFGSALARGILCNFLVCLAVWLCFSARTVTGKILSIIFPITAFVAAGFEHSIANMYFIPMGIMLSGQSAVLGAAGVATGDVANLTWLGFAGNLVPVTIGNIIGGGILLGAVYWLAYLRNDRAVEAATTRPWLKRIIPALGRTQQEAAVSTQLDELIRTKLAEPATLDQGSKALLAVLGRARDDSSFLAKLAENPAETLKDCDLTPEDQAALTSGDIRCIESKLGTLDEPLRTWLTARLSQEKW